MQKQVILTDEGLRNYEEELEFLKTVKRKEIAEKLKEARAQGDLSENAEYDAAKDEQGINESRIPLVFADLMNRLFRLGADHRDPEQEKGHL